VTPSRGHLRLERGDLGLLRGEVGVDPDDGGVGRGMGGGNGVGNDRHQSVLDSFEFVSEKVADERP
jgi:hypothetical protein